MPIADLNSEAWCVALLSCLLEAVEAIEDPSSFQISCTGLQAFDSPKIDTNRPLSSGCASKKRAGPGGFTCCVPGFLLTVKNLELSVYIFPNAKNVQSKDLRKNGSILSPANVFLLPKDIECVLCIFWEDVKRT